MKTYLHFIAVFFFLWSVGLSAAEPLAPQAKLSPSGIRRLRENKQILIESLETTEKNIKHSVANQKTIETQILEIAKTEEELNKLKLQYENFIASANKELDINQEEVKKLSRQRGGQSSTGELKERKDWEKNTRNKVQDVVTLLRKLVKDSKILSARKSDLEKQKANWSEREKQHQSLLSELNTKKQVLEDQLKGDS